MKADSTKDQNNATLMDIASGKAFSTLDDRVKALVYAPINEQALNNIDSLIQEFEDLNYPSTDAYENNLRALRDYQKQCYDHLGRGPNDKSDSN